MEQSAYSRQSCFEKIIYKFVGGESLCFAKNADVQ